MHLRERDEAGRSYTLDDPLAAPLRALPMDAAAITRFAPVFGELAGEPRLVTALSRAIDALRAHGVVGALAAR
jgi:fructuronate reductase